jgi:endonuclease YncB( thermonuclease family)
MRLRALSALILAVFIYSINTHGQDASAGIATGPCGESFGIDSCGVGTLKARVVEVADDLSLAIQLPRGARKRVRLVGIDVSGAPRAALDWLRSRVEGRDVEVVVFCATRLKEAELEGRVFAGDGEVNEDILELGLAAYRDSGAMIDRYNDCLYRGAEQRAKAARVGIWSSDGQRPN